MQLHALVVPEQFQTQLRGLFDTYERACEDCREEPMDAPQSPRMLHLRDVERVRNADRPNFTAKFGEVQHLFGESLDLATTFIPLRDRVNAESSLRIIPISRHDWLRTRAEYASARAALDVDATLAKRVDLHQLDIPVVGVMMRKEVARGSAFISDQAISGADLVKFVSQVRAGSPSHGPACRPLYNPEGSVAMVIG